MSILRTILACYMMVASVLTQQAAAWFLIYAIVTSPLRADGGSPEVSGFFLMLSAAAAISCIWLYYKADKLTKIPEKEAMAAVRLLVDYDEKGR